MKQVTNYTKITLLLMSSMTLLASVAVTTTMPHLKDHFAHPNIEFLSRLMLTMPSLAISFLAPFLSVAIKKIGKKNSAFIGLLLFGIFGSAGLYLNSIEILLVSRFLLGIGMAVLMIISTTLVGDYFEGEERYKFMSKQNAFIALGGVIFVFSGGVLADIFWRLPFGVYLLGLLLLPAVFLHIFDIKSKTYEQNEKLDKNLYYIYFLAFLYMCIFFILPTQMPFLVINVYEASGKLAGAIIASSFALATVGAIFYSKLKRKLAFWQIYALATTIVACGMIIVGFVTNVYFFFVTSCIMGFGSGIAMTNMPAWMLSYTKISSRIKASAFLSSSIFLGQFFSPFLTYPFVKKFGVQHSFQSIGIIILTINISVILVRKFIIKK